MSAFVDRIRTGFALGPRNLVRVGLYRLGVRTGLHAAVRLRADVPVGPFFRFPDVKPLGLPASSAWLTETLHFGWRRFILDGKPPQWLANPFTGADTPDPQRHWSRIADFDPRVGDIKTVWEASRFDWLGPNAQRAREGDTEALHRLNDWISDWLRVNAPYRGPNWKCGQESSIRVINLAIAALILDQVDNALPPLLELVQLHLRRIAPTMAYALGQDNNHGTSEAAALFVGGSWLAANGVKQGLAWARLGRNRLEERVGRLVSPDGSFSQYSTNYHRLMLDTLSLAEIWRQRLGLKDFSPQWRQRARAASHWLRVLTDPRTGDAPNIGANDGSRLISLTDLPYRDYRPSVQLANELFSGFRAYSDEGPWDLPAKWLSIRSSERQAPAVSDAEVFDHGGYVALRRGKLLAVLRYPRFRFRPGQADLLHVDFWRDGEPVLSDGGSGSYADLTGAAATLATVEGHNTIQFDARDQMPRLGRFLYGRWLKTIGIRLASEAPDGLCASAAYRDDQGGHHEREICLGQALTIEDHIDGPWKKATLRWRLEPGDWRQAGQTVTNGATTISITATAPIVSMGVKTGWVSRRYLEIETTPILEVQVEQPCKIKTVVNVAA